MAEPDLPGGATGEGLRLDRARRDAGTNRMRLHDTLERIEAKNADLSGSVFNNVNFAGCAFENVSFSGASFEDINMSGWRVNDVNLSGLQLTKANLAAASISESRLDGMTIDGVPVTEMVAADRATQEVKPQ